MGFIKTVLILLCSFSLSYAHACSCSNLSIGQRVVSSDIVVVGEVLESKQVCLETVGEHCDGPTVFYVQNTELLKGEGRQSANSEPLGKSTFISHLGNCTFHPQKGQKVLLFGKHIPGTVDTYTTNVCSRNRRIEGPDELSEISDIKTFLELYEDNKALSNHSKSMIFNQ